MTKETEKKLLADVTYLKNLWSEMNKTASENLSVLKEINERTARIERKVDEFLKSPVKFFKFKNASHYAIFFYGI